MRLVLGLGWVMAVQTWAFESNGAPTLIYIYDWSARVNHVREWNPINLQIWEEDCHQIKHDLRCGPIWIWHLWSNAHTVSPILERAELVTF